MLLRTVLESKTQMLTNKNFHSMRWKREKITKFTYFPLLRGENPFNGGFYQHCKHGCISLIFKEWELVSWDKTTPPTQNPLIFPLYTLYMYSAVRICIYVLDVENRKLMQGSSNYFWVVALTYSTSLWLVHDSVKILGFHLYH